MSVVIWHSTSRGDRTDPHVERLLCEDVLAKPPTVDSSMSYIKQHGRCLDIEHAYKTSGELAWVTFSVFLIIIAFITFVVWDSRRKH